MRNYGQFCPVARGSEILAERWTPIILRNVLLGCRTFNEIAAGAPGLSRALLTRRLHELERAGVIEIRPKPHGNGSLYEPTPAGRELWPVLNALGGWAERWMEATPDHAHPDVVLWSWFSGGFLRHDRLPDRRVVVRFDFETLGRRVRCWALIERRESELCSFDPGFGDDLVVTVADALTFARWHLGLIDWATALRSGGVQVVGPRDLSRALPTWNSGPEIHARMRAEQERTPGGTPPLPSQPASAPVDPEPQRDLGSGRVARCRSASDVVAALRFGRERGLGITVGGDVDDGLVLDLGAMRAVTVDPAQRTATAQAGVRWGELDAATQAFGLATTGAVVPRGGVAGHTLRGGLGWLMRRHGLTVDNLLAAEVVTADGERVTASGRDHDDLFWGLRGGGGGLGIVTSFTYRLHPVGPEVLAGQVVWALEDAPEVLRAYRELAAAAPPEVATAVTLRRAPPEQVVPVELYHRPVCVVRMLALGEPDQAARLLAPLRTFGRPLLDLVKHRPYTNLQSLTAATIPAGRHGVRRSIGLRDLDDTVIDAMVDHAARAGSPWSHADLFHLGGAVAAVAPDATAYAGRDVTHQLDVDAVWLPHQPIGDAETAWATAFVTDVAARAPFVPEVDQRLVDLRRRYDPDRVFQPCRAKLGP